MPLSVCACVCEWQCGWQCECVRRMAMAAWKCRPTSFAIKRKCPIRAVLAIVKNKFVFPVCCIPFCLALSLSHSRLSLSHTLFAPVWTKISSLSAHPPPPTPTVPSKVPRESCVYYVGYVRGACRLPGREEIEKGSERGEGEEERC